MAVSVILKALNEEARIGPAIESHDAFPNRVNVEFVEIVSRERIRQRTWERGTGETLACGSGACAVGVVSMLRGAVDARVTIELRGGELRLHGSLGALRRGAVGRCGA